MSDPAITHDNYREIWSKRYTPPRFVPADCPHCEYDRRFPGFESGGWLEQANNGPIVPCPLCNESGSHPRLFR